MVKNKFYKNLYQSISCFATLLIFVFFLLLGFCISLQYENNHGWILLLTAVSLIVMFFIVGFYWMFQKVEVCNTGIKITLFRTVIRDVKWEDVVEITAVSLMRNPAFSIKIKGAPALHLDDRNKIRRALLCFGNEIIIKQLQSELKH